MLCNFFQTPKANDGLKSTQIEFIINLSLTKMNTCLDVVGLQGFTKGRSCNSLVGNVADMSPRVIVMPTMSAENGRRHNVANDMTGFVAGSRVGLDTYLVFFYLEIFTC